MEKTKISCITPTFNRAPLLKRAIESTISQSYPHWELIIVDDGSTDHTKKVVQDFQKKDQRIKYFKNPGKGGNAARNYGIMQAKGEWIAFLDDDDENLPHRFESQLKAAKMSNTQFIISGFNSLDSNGNLLKSLNKGLWAKGAGITSRWFIARSLILETELFDEIMPAMQECELSYRISDFCVFANHFDIVVNKYNIEDRVSSGQNGMRGKILLLKKQKNKMPPLEAAWWYYSIALDYYDFNDVQNAIKYFKYAADLDKRSIYYLAYLYAIFFLHQNKLDRLLKKVNVKILQTLADFRYPKLIRHPTVD